MAYEPPFEHSNRIGGLCMEISELVGMVSPQADLAKNPILHRKLRIRTIHSSLLIEGNGLDESAVTAILDGKRVLGNAHDILEVENAKKAYDLIPALDPYSMDDLLRCHRVMMDGLVGEAGRLRSGNVGVFDGDALIHVGTPAAYVPEVMADIFEWLAHTDMHPLLSSCVFHFEFEFVHPFADGNGRTGRLWQTLLLSRWRPILEWLPVESTIRKRQKGYYAALAKSDAAGSSEIFVEFMLEAIRDALIPYARPADEQAIAARQALAYFESNPQGNVSSLAASLGCSKRTAERIVAHLKESGTLKRIGSTRGGRWEVDSKA